MPDDHTFPSRLRDWARSDPGRVAIREPVRRVNWLGRSARHNAWHEITYAELDRLADRYASCLERAGTRDGDRVLYLLHPSIHGYAVFYGLLRVGAVPLFIDPRMPLARLLACVTEAAPRVLIGVTAARVLRLIARQAFSTTEISLPSGTGWMAESHLRKGAATQAQESFGTNSGTTCYIAYTSGSTGTAKGVPYTYGMVRAQLAVVHEVCDWRAGMQVVMCFAPFVPYALSDGLTAILPAMDFSRPARAPAERVVEAILDHDASCAFASPAIWRRVVSWCGPRGLMLRSVVNAVTVGAPVEPPLHDALVPLLHSDGQLHTPYGATEAMPIATGHTGTLADTWGRARLGHGTCVGHAVTGAEVHAIRMVDEPVPRWSSDLDVPADTVGELVVGGDNVSAEYLARPFETANAKIHRGDRVFHRTGDLGRVDAEGRIWFCGRKSQRVETADTTLYPDALETVFAAHPLITRGALVGIGARGRQTPVLCVELARGTRLTRALVREIASMADATPYRSTVKHVLQHPGFPVDARHNAKIQRERLATWAAKRLKGVAP